MAHVWLTIWLTEMQMGKFESSQLFPHKNGRWRGQIKYKDEHGKWRNKSKVLEARGKREAQKELDAWREEMEREAEWEAMGTVGDTVADYMSAYIEGRAARVEPSTIMGYKGLLRRQIEPFIGSVPLDDLNPDMVQAWVAEIAEHYGAETVRKAFVLLRSAMRQAVERDRLPKDPTRTVDVPRKGRTRPNSLTERGVYQVVRFLDLADVTPANIGVRLALFTGMREGEVCALRWRDVDLEGGTLEVRSAFGYRGSTYYEKAPKTGGSARTLHLPEPLAAALRSHRAAVAAECLAAGTPFSAELFVTGYITGKNMHPHTLYKRWRRIAEALELVGTEGRPVTFHDLRHTFATVAIKSGADVKTVSSAMGHANAAMTLNTYASADPEAKRRLAERMGAEMTAEPRGGEVLRMQSPAPSEALNENGVANG